MKVADYIVQFVRNQGVRHVFAISGAGNLHILDSIYRDGRLSCLCTHHEQAAAMAMEAYARTTGNFGVCCVTTGPAGSNAITGVLGAWLDSTPCLMLSGQVKREHTSGNSGLRQLGVQEFNIVKVVESFTKYAAMVDDPALIRFHLEKAVHLAKSGRPGPSWLDLPADVLGAQVDPATLKPYVPPPSPHVPGLLAHQAAQVLSLLERAERPLLLAGNGIRLSHAVPTLRSWLARYKIPIATSWNGIDLVESDHRLYVGRPGVYGQRGANFALQNCDLLLAVGSRLSIPQVGYDPKHFARGAKMVVVDIDPAELKKEISRRALHVQADAGDFLESCLAVPGRFRGKDIAPWRARCRAWRDRYPTNLPEYREQKKHVNSYYFIDTLSEVMDARGVVVTDMGTSFTCTHQTFRIKRGQRLFTSSGLASMGFGLPGAIGACLASGRQVVCLSGDGALQMNIQELQTVVHYQLPIKLFVFNNNGYLTIRQTQRGMFAGRLAGSDPGSGVSCPDIIKVGRAYGLPTAKISSHADLKKTLKGLLAKPGPGIIEIMMDENQPLIPRISSQLLPTGRMVSKPLEDLFPFLERGEFKENMIVPPLEEG